MKMNELIGYCGLDCGQCDARIATVNNDDELRARTAKLWCGWNNTDEIKPAPGALTRQAAQNLPRLWTMRSPEKI